MWRARAPRRARAALCLLAACALAAARAQSPPAGAPLPGFAALEASGAVIGKIKIDNQNIFDLSDPREDNALFRLANLLHPRTRDWVIRRQLLFEPGDRVSVRLIEETERLLRLNSTLYDVRIRPIAYHDNVVDVEVTTRDTWSLAPGISVSRAGGANTRRVTLQEFNLLGLGIYVGITRASDPDRTGTVTRVTQQHAFDGWTVINASSARLSDGESHSFGIDRPFYALQTRRAGGFSVSHDDRVDTLYASGAIVGGYRHTADAADAYAGWSAGLVDGWTQRHSLGLSYHSDAYELAPGVAPPAALPLDLKTAAPYYRYELREDDYRKLTNQDLIERPEYFTMGLSAQFQIGRALTGLGSTEDLWLYSSSLHEGLTLLHRHLLLATVSINGRHGDPLVEQALASGSVRLYRQQSKHSIFFASLSGDRLRAPPGSQPLTLGGDNGLRGYPLRYQSGDRRLLLTLEQRAYSDLYIFRLFRIGGAAFYDVGRAWGQNAPDTPNAGWIGDAGIGLRIMNARTAFGTVVHADLAFPLHRDPAIRSVQFLIQVQSSY